MRRPTKFSLEIAKFIRSNPETCVRDLKAHLGWDQYGALHAIIDRLAASHLVKKTKAVPPTFGRAHTLSWVGTEEQFSFLPVVYSVEDLPAVPKAPVDEPAIQETPAEQPTDDDELARLREFRERAIELHPELALIGVDPVLVEARQEVAAIMDSNLTAAVMRGQFDHSPIMKLSILHINRRRRREAQAA